MWRRSAAFVTLRASATAMKARICLKSMRGRYSIPIRHDATPKDVLDRNQSQAQITRVRTRVTRPRGGFMRGVKAILWACAFVIALPWAAFAQAGASITGTVRDSSGAVLPG